MFSLLFSRYLCFTLPSSRITALFSYKFYVATSLRICLLVIYSTDKLLHFPLFFSNYQECGHEYLSTYLLSFLLTCTLKNGIAESLVCVFFFDTNKLPSKMVCLKHFKNWFNIYLRVFSVAGIVLEAEHTAWW